MISEIKILDLKQDFVKVTTVIFKISKVVLTAEKVSKVNVVAVGLKDGHFKTLISIDSC